MSQGIPFQNSVEGGGNIIIPFLQSPNYVPGVSGWRISRNGDAEFASQTLRGPLIVINPITGLVVASISDTGNIAGQYASIENDIILQGQSLADRLADGKGLVGFFGTFATPPAPGTGGPPGTYTNTAWFRFPAVGNRLYEIHSTFLTLVNGSITTEEFECQWIVTDTNGNGPTPLAGFKDHVDNFVPFQAPYVLFALDSNPAISATVTFQLQSRQVTAGTDFSFSNPGGWNLVATDVGPLTGAMNVGGTGAAAGTTQRTTVYSATLSQSYDGSGNQIVSTDLWRSNFDDGKGQTTSLCIFPGATIRADLAGATIQSATLTMFCTTAEETNGSIAFDPSTAVAIPGTQASFTGGTHVQSDKWPVPGWYSFSILSGFLTDILAPGNANAMKISAAFTGGAATRFAGASVANKPYITIVYTK